MGEGMSAILAAAARQQEAAAVAAMVQNHNNPNVPLHAQMHAMAAHAAASGAGQVILR